MTYYFTDKDGKHRYDSLLNARRAAENACERFKKEIPLIESRSGKVKCVFCYDEGEKKVKVVLPAKNP